MKIPENCPQSPGKVLKVVGRYACGLYLYHHFSSDGHTLDDISIMPIEVVVSEPDDGITLGCKRLQREEFWYRELCTIYPYGLNDNVKGVGNVSKSDDELIVYALFNKSERKFRKRKPHRRRRRVTSNEVSEQRVLCLDIRVLVLLSDYVPTLWV